MHSSIIALLASTVIGLASAENLKPCGNAFYVPSQYTCYSGNKLCPIMNGVATKPCGQDCYSETQYSCKNGKLAPPTPAVDITFRAFVKYGGRPRGAEIEASGLVFRIGGSPSTYCPPNVGPCPSGDDTYWTCKSGYCNLNVAVPGGQQIYIAPNGVVSFTQAHSGLAPPGSAFKGFSVDNGYMKFAGKDFYSCPPIDQTSNYQLYSPVIGKRPENCVSVQISIDNTNVPAYGAWQYT